MRAIVYLFLALAAKPAWGDTLLVQLHEGIGTFDSPGVGGTLRVFPTVDGSYGTEFAHGWGLGETVPIGQTFAADAATVEAMEGCLVNSNCYIHFLTGPNIGASRQFPVDDVWARDSEFGFLQAFVPQLGTGFSGYDITAITRTIDDGWLTYDGRYFYGYIEQTVRFWGVPVPEPATWLIVVFPIVFHAFGRSVRFPVAHGVPRQPGRARAATTAETQRVGKARGHAFCLRFGVGALQAASPSRQVTHCDRSHNPDRAVMLCVVAA